MIFLQEKKKNGFTLIEVILTLVIVAILGATYAQIFGAAFVRSSIPTQNIRASFKLREAMENITTDYENDPTDLTGLKSKINANTYGQYGVVTNKFIEFNNNVAIDTTGPQNLLMVTINNRSGVITTLFTLQ